MLFNVNGVAEKLGGLGLSTVRKLIVEGKLPAIKIGRRVMVTEEALAKFIEEQGRGGVDGLVAK